MNDTIPKSGLPFSVVVISVTKHVLSFPLLNNGKMLASVATTLLNYDVKAERSL